MGGFLEAISCTVVIQYLAVLFAGAGVGTCELLSRFKDDPLLALANRWAWAYIAWNAIGSLLALALILYMPITFGAPVNSKLDHVLTVLVAGFGSMAFLRSSFFIARFGDKEIPVGAAFVLQTILDTLVEGLERDRIPQRSATIKELMAGYTLEKAAANLPAYLFSLKSFPNDLQKQIGAAVKEAASRELISDRVKVEIIGQLLMKNVGQDAFKAATKNCPD